MKKVQSINIILTNYLFTLIANHSTFHKKSKASMVSPKENE